MHTHVGSIPCQYPSHIPTCENPYLCAGTRVYQGRATSYLVTRNDHWLRQLRQVIQVLCPSGFCRLTCFKWSSKIASWHTEIGF
jgi:hypothetical protein